MVKSSPNPTNTKPIFSCGTWITGCMEGAVTGTPGCPGVTLARCQPSSRGPRSRLGWEGMAATTSHLRKAQLPLEPPGWSFLLQWLCSEEMFATPTPLAQLLNPWKGRQESSRTSVNADNQCHWALGSDLSDTEMISARSMKDNAQQFYCDAQNFQ